MDAGMYDGWVYFPSMSMSMQDLAIRRFCPARELEQHQHSDSFLYLEQTATLSRTQDPRSCYDFYHSRSSSDDSTAFIPLTTDDCDFVDSFINMDPSEDGPDNQLDDTTKRNHDTSASNNPAVLFEFDNNFEDDPNNSGEDIVQFMNVDGDEEYRHVVDDPANRYQVLLPTTTSYTNTGGGDVEEGIVCGGIVDSNSANEHEGLQLVHLLLVCAEAVGCRDSHLAHSLISQIWSSNALNPFGDSLQRVSCCFALGLKSRLSSLLQGSSSSSNNVYIGDNTDDDLTPTRNEKLEAFHILYQTTPYIAFGFMAANEAIVQAAQGKDRLHILDLGAEQSLALQWPSLLRTLASRAEGPPRSVRITGLIEDPDSCADVEAAMRLLVDDAKSIGIPLEFHILLTKTAEYPGTGPSPAVFTRENLKLTEGETLFVNSVLHLHRYVKESRGSLKAILQSIKKLNPALLTLVEQDASHNGPFFLGRFLESLHYYSAIFDSLEASLPRNSPQRRKVERNQYAEEIRNIVATEGWNRVERHERADQWRRQFGRAGFQVVGMNKCASQARMMLSVYGCEGYTLSSERGCLLLGWKGRPIMFASAWQVHHNHLLSSSSSTSTSPSSS